jgi:hypothetical protein
LSDEQRADTCVDYNHPFRQYHNRGVSGAGRQVFGGFSRAQRQLLTDVFYSGLANNGQARIPDQDVTHFTGVNSMHVLLCGDPNAPPYQLIITGVHLNLRLGGKSREGAAFGGPQVYGDQSGDGRAGLPGNIYRDQFLTAQRLLQSLDDGRRRVAVLDEAPVQTGIELQGRSGSFPGIPVAELTPDGKALVREIIDRIFSTYSADDVAYARECLTANGGIDALFLSYYRHGEDGGIPEAQVFRLEGPSAVFYFRGYPHVHAFMNVAMDGDAPLSSGEPLGTNPQWRDHAAVQKLFETALRAESAADLGYYPAASVAGRLRSGAIRSGDIYTLESWQETAEVVEVRGADLTMPFTEALRARSIEFQPEKTFRIATSGWGANELKGKLPRIGNRMRGIMVRDLTVRYLRSHSFSEIPYS